jgi:uncharacterized integral membrane protein
LEHLLPEEQDSGHQEGILMLPEVLELQKEAWYSLLQNCLHPSLARMAQREYIQRLLLVLDLLQLVGPNSDLEDYSYLFGYPLELSPLLVLFALLLVGLLLSLLVLT